MTDPAGLIREVRIEPGAESWREHATRSWERARRDEHCLALRSGLGLPIDRPVIMTGHQPGFWHLGVLSKFFAAEAASNAIGGSAAWIVPDQDDADPGALMIPTENEHGRLMRRTVRILPEPPAGVAVGCVPRASSVVRDIPPDHGAIRDGILKAARLCDMHVSASSLAEQTALAVRDALVDDLAPAPMVFASRLFEEDGAWAFARAVVDDADSAVDAYNRAVAAHPGAGVSPLARQGERVELPMWRLRKGQARERVWSDTAPDTPREEIAPRALLMTAILRRFVCDFFIHGLGGWEYDRVSETWMREWRGETVAPMGLVTASVRLDLGRGEPVSREDAAKAVWRAHHARHDPEMLGRSDLAKKKRALVDAISLERERGGNAGPRYADLTGLLRSFRDEARDGLKTLERDAEDALSRVAEADIIADRTWPFVLHSRATVLALRSRIRREFGGEL